MTTGGTRVGRQWVQVLDTGEIVIDWGGDVYQNTVSGEFMKLSAGHISHTITDDELAWMLRIGRVLDYDAHEVSFPVLPDRPLHLME